MKSNEEKEGNKVLDAVISLNEHIDKISETIEAEEGSDSPDKEKWAEAVLEIFVACSIRVMALDATSTHFSKIDIPEEDIPSANDNVKHMLKSIQQAYQIMQSMFMMSEENELGIEFNDETVTPILKRLTEEHFDEMISNLKGV